MGIFGKLFDKKECSVCGGEIGLLGNRKLEDGNLCKNCAKQLSEWFSDRRHSTVAEIREQLAYREANKQAVADFRVTRTIGRDYVVHIDEDARKFLVTSAGNWREDNPDVLDFSQVTGCGLDIQEDRTEQKFTNSAGEEVSYRPPRYTYEYDFYVIIMVRHPYFDQMRFRLNSSTLEIPFSGMAAGSRIMNPKNNRDYMEYLQMGEQIRQVLTTAREQIRQEAAEAAKPKQARSCSYCGATCIPDANGCCEYCGGPMGG